MSAFPDALYERFWAVSRDVIRLMLTPRYFPLLGIFFMILGSISLADVFLTSWDKPRCCKLSRLCTLLRFHGLWIPARRLFCLLASFLWLLKSGILLLLELHTHIYFLPKLSCFVLIYHWKCIIHLYNRVLLKLFISLLLALSIHIHLITQQLCCVFIHPCNRIIYPCNQIFYFSN